MPNNQPDLLSKDRDITNIILKNGNEVLLVVRSGHENIDYQYHWAAPGGSVEKSENAKLASLRELFEEAFDLHGKDADNLINKLNWDVKELQSRPRNDGRMVHGFVVEISDEDRAQLQIKKNWENLLVDWIHVKDLPPAQRFHPDFIDNFNTFLGAYLPNEIPIGQRSIDKIAPNTMRRWHGSPNRLDSAQHSFMYSSIGNDLNGSGFYGGSAELAATYASPKSTPISGGWLHTVDYLFSEEECISLGHPKILNENQRKILLPLLRVENIELNDNITDKGILELLGERLGSEKSREILYLAGLKGVISDEASYDKRVVVAFNPNDVRISHVEKLQQPTPVLQLVMEHQNTIITKLAENVQSLRTELEEVNNIRTANQKDFANLGLEKITPPKNIISSITSSSTNFDQATYVEDFIKKMHDESQQTAAKFNDLQMRRDKLYDAFPYTQDYEETLHSLEEKLNKNSFGKLIKNTNYKNAKANYDDLQRTYDTYYIPEINTYKESEFTQHLDSILSQPLDERVTDPNIKNIAEYAKTELQKKFNRAHNEKPILPELLSNEIVRIIQYTNKIFGNNEDGKNFADDFYHKYDKNIRSSLHREGKEQTASSIHYLATQGNFELALKAAINLANEDVNPYIVLNLCKAFPEEAINHKPLISEYYVRGTRGSEGTLRQDFSQFIDDNLVTDKLQQQVRHHHSLSNYDDILDLFHKNKETSEHLLTNGEIINLALNAQTGLRQALITGKIDKDYYVAGQLQLAEAIAKTDEIYDLYTIRKTNLARGSMRDALLDNDFLGKSFLEGIKEENAMAYNLRATQALSLLEQKLQKSLLRENELLEEKTSILESQEKSIEKQKLQLIEYRTQNGQMPIENLSIEEFVSAYQRQYRSSIEGKAVFPNDQLKQLVEAYHTLHPEINLDSVNSKIEKIITFNTEQKIRAPFPETIVPSDHNQLKELGSLDGITRPTLLLDEATGEKYVVKDGAHPTQAEIEYKANQIYHALKIPVPESKLYERDGRKTFVARFIEGDTHAAYDGTRDSSERYNLKKNIGSGYIADAILSNLDVVANGKNVIVGTSDGRAYRIDVGGSLTLSASGRERLWQADDITNLDSLRDNKYINSAQIYGRVSYPELAEQIIDFRKNMSAVHDLVKKGVLTTQEYSVIESRLVKIEEKYAYITETYNQHNSQGEIPKWFDRIVSENEKIKPLRDNKPAVVSSPNKLADISPITNYNNKNPINDQIQKTETIYPLSFAKTSYVNAASNGAGMAMAAYSVGTKFIGEDATYNIDKKVGGKQAEYANASLVADGMDMTASSAGVATGVVAARKSTADIVTQTVSGSSAAANATANAAQQAADVVKKSLEEAGKNSDELAKVAAGALKNASEAAAVADKLNKFSKTLGPLGIGLAVVSGGFQYGAAQEAGDGYRAAAAIGGTTGGLVGGIMIGAGTGFLAGSVVPGIGNITLAIVGAAGGLIGGLGGAMIGDSVGKHFFGDNFQLAFDQKQRESLKPQLEALAKISQKFQQNETIFTQIIQTSSTYEEAQKSGDQSKIDKTALALLNAQEELKKLPKPTKEEIEQLQALQGTLAVTMINQKAMERPDVNITKQLQAAINTTNAILNASQALSDATTNTAANNNQSIIPNKIASKSM